MLFRYLTSWVVGWPRSDNLATLSQLELELGKINVVVNYELFLYLVPNKVSKLPVCVLLYSMPMKLAPTARKVEILKLCLSPPLCAPPDYSSCWEIYKGHCMSYQYSKVLWLCNGMEHVECR